MRTSIALLLAALLSPIQSFADNEDLPQEMYSPNQAGGYVALTTEKCGVQGADKMFEYRAYSTDEDGTIREGCWFSPGLEGAPAGAIPIVNIFYEGQTFNFAQSDFTPEIPIPALTADVSDDGTDDISRKETF